MTDMISSITKELTADEVSNDPGWVTYSTVVCTGHGDRAALNGIATCLFGEQTGRMFCAGEKP